MRFCYPFLALRTIPCKALTTILARKLQILLRDMTGEKVLPQTEQRGERLVRTAQPHGTVETPIHALLVLGQRGVLGVANGLVTAEDEFFCEDLVAAGALEAAVLGHSEAGIAGHLSLGLFGQGWNEGLVGYLLVGIGRSDVTPRSLGLRDFFAENEDKSGAKFIRNRCEMCLV